MGNVSAVTRELNGHLTKPIRSIIKERVKKMSKTSEMHLYSKRKNVLLLFKSTRPWRLTEKFLMDF